MPSVQPRLEKSARSICRTRTHSCMAERNSRGRALDCKPSRKRNRARKACFALTTTTAIISLAICPWTATVALPLRTGQRLERARSAAKSPVGSAREGASMEQVSPKKLSQAPSSVAITMIVSRSFIGTFPCFICKKRVRIYDWLSECILCAKCKSSVEVSESIAETRHERGDQHD